jgi:tetratricopeptide (TPR) repeat protein
MPSILQARCFQESQGTNNCNQGREANFFYSSIYVLRSEANLKMQNAVRAAEDAARAFEMYQPPVPANLDDRFKCHILRGSALRRLQMYTEALMDFVAAEKLNPKDEDIQQHCADLRNIIQNNGGDEWKKEWETDLL